jgi:hypothetical protein
MASVSKKEFNAYDRVLDAAAELADLIQSGDFDLSEEALEALTIFLANSAPQVRRILSRCR